MKRLFDLCFASLALLLLTPVMIAVMLAIYLSDRGPILFRQQRVGRDGELFGMFKFRSMVVDAAHRGGYSTMERDPRITPVGRFLRRSSLDELPQLFNVLKGDMSIVGPRPDVDAQRANYNEAEWRARTSVRPGITGLAQATLRSGATHEQRTTMDLAYASEVSLKMDLKIIMMTIKQVVMKGGN